jgi:hypothetical protein
MRTLTSAACLFGALLLASNGAAAQDRSPVDIQMGLDLITSRIQNVAAEQVGTGTRGWGLQVGGAATAYRVLSLTAELGAVAMRDGEQFSQDTDQGTMSSAVSSVLGTMAAGVRTPSLALGEENPLRLSVGVNAGHTWLKTTRGIDRCIDCHSEDLELRAGDFWEPSLYLTRGRGGLSARYRVYSADSNWENALMVGYTFVLRLPGAPKDVPAEPEPEQ